MVPIELKCRENCPFSRQEIVGGGDAEPVIQESAPKIRPCHNMLYQGEDLCCNNVTEVVRTQGIGAESVASSFYNNLVLFSDIKTNKVVSAVSDGRLYFGKELADLLTNTS